MVLSLFPHSLLSCVLFIPSLCCCFFFLFPSSALCLPCFHPPASELACHSLLPCFSATSPSQWLSPPFGPLVSFSLIARLPPPLFSCLPGRASFLCLLGFLTLAPTWKLHSGFLVFSFPLLVHPFSSTVAPLYGPFPFFLDTWSYVSLSPLLIPFTPHLCSLFPCLLSFLNPPISPLMSSPGFQPPPLPAPLSLFSFLLAADRGGVVTDCIPDFTCRPRFSTSVSL